MTSFRNVIGEALFLTMVSMSVWGQTVTQPTLKPIHCPYFKRPESVESTVQAPLHSRIDSTILLRELDSVYGQITGRWYLFQIQGGWSGPQLPHREVNITIDRLGNAVISEKNQQLAVFRFKLRKGWQMYSSGIEGRKQSFFSKSINQLNVEVCQDTLVLNEALGDGQEYVFKR